MNNVIKALLILITLSFASCNKVAEGLGGSMTIELEKDQKLVTCSWKKGASLWVLTRARKEGEQPDTYKYAEKSSFGILEGTVTIIER